MNYYDAMQIQRAADGGLPVSYERLVEARTFIERTREIEAIKRIDARASLAKEARLYRVTPAQVKPGYDQVCGCGSTYGAHRVNDYACPNPAWKPGNGNPQWMAKTFARAA